MKSSSYAAVCTAVDPNGAAKFSFERKNIAREEYAIVTAGETVRVGDTCQLAWDFYAQSYWVEMGSIRPSGE